MAAEGMRLPGRWDGGTISTNSDVIWVMWANMEFAQIAPKAGFVPKQAVKTASPLAFHSVPAVNQAQNHADNHADNQADDQDVQKDYFIEKDGVVFAGNHILVDLWGAKNLDDQDLIERALRTAADRCGATLLHIHLHQFSGSGGVSGVAVLAESHISVHTWPERDFAAFDVFMCGKCDPMDAVPILRDFFEPSDLQVNANRRGVVR